MWTARMQNNTDDRTDPKDRNIDGGDTSVNVNEKPENAARKTLRIFQKGFNFSQDGPGNRLVYHLQGCNLRCPWCSNPEGLELRGGKEYTVDELLEEVNRSRMMFFDGGGVTLTGGEVTLQTEAVKELFRCLREQGVNTCIETNGTAPRLPELIPVLDHLIMDVKHYDPEKHRRVTGLSNEIVFRNVQTAVAAGMKPALRIPLIGGFNASAADAEGFAGLFRRLGAAGDSATVELLRYHEYGKDKYKQLGLPYTMDETARVSTEALKEFTEILQSAGITVIRT